MSASLVVPVIELSMFNKVCHAFLSNPVKINKKPHVSFEIMAL